MSRDAEQRRKQQQIREPHQGSVRVKPARTLMGPQPPTWVVARVLTATSCKVQRVAYMDDPPQEGRVIAVDDFFDVYPPPGWEWASLEWFVFPLIDSEGTTHTIYDQEALDYEAGIVSGKTRLGVSFFICKVHRLAGTWVIDPPLKMPSNVDFLNEAAEMITGMGI